MNALGKHPHLGPPWRYHIMDSSFSTETYLGRLSLRWGDRNPATRRPYISKVMELVLTGQRLRLQSVNP